jgi:thymidine kinase
MNQGELIMIIGPMFSEKTTRLIQYINKYKTLGMKQLIVKPSIDTRYTKNNELCSHNMERENCITFKIDKLNEIFLNSDYKDSQVIIIDEAQFFTNIFEVVKYMVEYDNKKVYIAALNGDYNRELFGDIYKLLPICNNIEFMTALCIECRNGTPGIFSKRIIREESEEQEQEQEQVCVAGNDRYNVVCRYHYKSNTNVNILQ